MEVNTLQDLDSNDYTEFVPFDNSSYSSQQLQNFMPFKSNNILHQTSSFISLKSNLNNLLPVNNIFSPVSPISLKINMLPQNLHHIISKSFEKNLDTRCILRDNLSSISSKASNILSSIEDTNPAILKTLEAYKIPYPISELLIKKIIILTLESNT